MNKCIIKIVSILVSIIMIFSLTLNLNVVKVNAANNITTSAIDLICDKYGYSVNKYWTYKGIENQEKYTASSTKAGTNGYEGYKFGGGEECWAFARFVMSKVSGENVGSGKWKKIKASNVTSFQIGDVVCTGDNYNVSSVPHSAVVYSIKDGKYTFLEIWTGKYGHEIHKGGYNGNSNRNTLQALKNYGFTDKNSAYVYRYEGNLPTIVISNAKATNITSNGAKIECDINPAKTLNTVQITVWSDIQGIDKHQWITKASSINGKHYVFDMNVSKFNNQRGSYKVNIHVFYTDGTKDMTASPITFTIPEPSIVHTHDYSIYVSTTKEATCTEAGTKVMKCSCGSTMNVTIPKTGHNYVTVPQKEPTCVKYGLTSYQKCSKCGAVTFSTSIPPTGHTEVIDEAVPATCTTDGLTEGKHCSKCNAVIVEQQVIPKLGHDAEKYNTYPCSETQYYRCRRCGLETYHNDITISTKNHTIVIDPAVEPTYTTTGLTEGSHCSVCGKVINEQEIIPMLNWNDDPDDKNDNYDYTDKYDDDTKDKQANYNSEKIDDKYIDKQNIEDKSNVEDKKNTTNDTNKPSINDNSIPVKKDNTQSVQKTTTEQPTTQQSSITGPSEQSSPATKKSEVQKVKIPSKPTISIKNEKGKKLVVNWRKVNNAKGYQVEYALDKKFTKSKKSKTQKNLLFTARNLKKTKVYYVRVRAYTLDSKGRKVYGKWSSTKKVKIKK